MLFHLNKPLKKKLLLITNKKKMNKDHNKKT